MAYISSSLRQQVIERADNRCEYCGLSQKGQAATFHIDHVIPVVEDGQTNLENLALACVSCSLFKSARVAVLDPDTSRHVPVFNPRDQIWGEHFRWNGVFLVGLTPTGRATLTALKMNRPVIIAIRDEEVLLNRHPP